MENFEKNPQQDLSEPVEKTGETPEVILSSSHDDNMPNKDNNPKDLNWLIIILSIIAVIVIGFLTSSVINNSKKPDVGKKPDSGEVSKVPDGGKSPLEDDSGGEEPLEENRLILATFAPREDNGLLPDGTTNFGGFDFSKLPDLVGAGINEMGSVIQFMAKDSGERQTLRGQFVNAVKPFGIKYFHNISTDGTTNLEDENFVRGSMWLDEPYVYFPGNDKNFNLASASSSPANASDFYVNYIGRLLSEERKSLLTGSRTAPLLSSNVIESVAWYDLKAGADGFWVEGLGSYYLSQIHFFNEYFDLNIPETEENYVRLIAAFERGAGNYFGKPWGFGVYSGTPLSLREQILEDLYDRGATYFFFWANHADATISTDETISLARHINTYALENSPTKSEAEIAILIPNGYLIPQGIYCSDSMGEAVKQDCIAHKGGEFSAGDMWNILPVIANDKNRSMVNPEYARVLNRIGEVIKNALADSGEFDILVNDDSLRQDYLERYDRVVRVE